MSKIFEPTTIGPMKLKNRLWRSSTWENKADDKGHLTPELIKVYEDLAKGGVGTILTGYAFICEEEQPNPGMMGIYSDDFIPEYKKFTDRVHDLGANIVMQIVYGGSSTSFNVGTRKIMGPSAVEEPVFKVTPVEMTKEDIKYIIKSNADAALRVKEAGFDGVQLHGAHGYLLSQFLTPYFNRRTDEYGGSIENRARIIYEILEAVREKVGPDYPVFIKMHSTDEWGENGLTPDESLIVAKGLQERGMTGIELSGGHLTDDFSTATFKQKLHKKENQSYFKEPAALIAAGLDIPIILVGGNRDMDVMEEILNTTDIEYFSMSRTLFSEPDLPNKWESGFRGKPRCIFCNKCWGSDTNMCILDRKKEKKAQ